MLLECHKTERPSVLRNRHLISGPVCFHFTDVINAAEKFQLLHLFSHFSHLTLYPHFSKKKKKVTATPNTLKLALSVFTSGGHCVNVYVCAMIRVSMLFVQLSVCVFVCDFFLLLCVCLVITAGVTTVCLIGVRLRGVLSCVNSGAL